MLARESGFFDNLVLLVGLLTLTYILLLGKPTGEPDYPYPFTLLNASATLKGIAKFPAYPEIGQDLIGFRGLLTESTAYPVLTRAYDELGVGIDWDVSNESTHPPTAFLLVAPFAFLPVNLAVAGWAWLMLVLLASTLVCYGFSRKMALGLAPILLLWPPMAYSLSQLTIVWMWGIAIGYRFARDRVFWGGVGIGIASLTKFFPALMVVGYLVKKQWAGLIGFVAVWVLALVAVIGLDTNVISEYLDVNRTNSFVLLARPENAALLALAYRWGGWFAAVAVVLLILGLVALLCWRFRERVLEKIYLWMGLSFLAVALLPLVWGYSVVPLMPVIFYLLSRRKLSAMTAGMLGLILAGLPGSPAPIAMSIGAVGLGLVFDLLPYRVFAASRLSELVKPRRDHARIPAGISMEFDSGK